MSLSSRIGGAERPPLFERGNHVSEGVTRAQRGNPAGRKLHSQKCSDFSRAIVRDVTPLEGESCLCLW